MGSLQNGKIPLGRIAGVNLYLHWSWFVVAAIEIQYRKGMYSSVAWNVAEYLALFLIVLTHEFGHAMACRSVGGTANQILLWPFGGVAYVRPPQRPGAMLWSIAAGPLVNVVLAPVLFGALVLAGSLGWADARPDLYLFVREILYINIGLLIFNMLPVYPLDGGQILRSLLWFWLGRGRSLFVATILGLVGGAGLIAYAAHSGDWWLAAICVYLGMNSWNSLKSAKAIRAMEKLPRRAGFACPSCRMPPPLGTYWTCGQCQQSFDTFANGGVCPTCSTQYLTTTCLDCREQGSMQAWTVL